MTYANLDEVLEAIKIAPTKIRLRFVDNERSSTDYQEGDHLVLANLEDQAKKPCQLKMTIT